MKRKIIGVAVGKPQKGRNGSHSRISYRGGEPAAAYASDKAFGIFRPLSDESAAQLERVLVKAQADLHEYLEWFGHENMNFTPRTDFGVTILPRKHTLRALMDDERLGRRFRFSRLIGDIALADEFREPLEIPLGDYDWYGTRGRIMVGQFTAGEQTAELKRQSGRIATMVHDCNGKQIERGNPDHVSFYKVRGGSPHNLDASVRQDLEDIVRQHFAMAAVGSIVLDSVVVGDGYNTPNALAA